MATKLMTRRPDIEPSAVLCEPAPAHEAAAGGDGGRLLATAEAGSWWLVLRFGLAGLLNTAFGYLVFATLVLLGCWPFAALIGSTVAGVAFNFQTSCRLVFRTRGRAVRFAVLYAAILGINWLALRGLQALGIHALAAQAIVVVPIAALSFLGQRAWVFARPVGQS